MQKSIDILTHFELEVKPEAYFQQLESERSGPQKLPQNPAKISHEERSPRVTIRLGQSGKPVPCGFCAEIQLNGDFCARCGVRRVNAGLEPIASILGRLFFLEESLEQQQLNLFSSEPEPKPGGIQLKGPCCCGNNFVRVGAGRRPHESSLHCSQCKKFIAWLPSSELKSFGKRGEG